MISSSLVGPGFSPSTIEVEPANFLVKVPPNFSTVCSKVAWSKVRRGPVSAMISPTSEPGVPSGTDFFLLLVLVAVSPVELFSVFAALVLDLAFALAPPLAVSAGSASLTLR